MYNLHKRKVTVSLLIVASLMVLIALCLALPRDEATASTPDPTPPSHPVVVVNNSPPPVVPVHVPIPPVVQPDPPKPVVAPMVDVVFALDTTGSMGGLIEGAKRKIWSIANQILSGQPRPDVRIGLVAYRDLGDEYVTRRFALSEDIDDVYANLRSFRADGGGDTPEHVNRALHDAIYKMKWRKGQNVLRLVFLVGDSPPHDGREGLYTSELSNEASRRGIVLNTVRCGSNSDTDAVWRRIASLAGGMYTSIRQDGAMLAITTPVDRRLAELNEKLSTTLVPYGSSGERGAAHRRAKINASMDGFAKAESAAFRAKSGRLDSADLVTAVGKGKKLDSIRDEDLPAEVAALPKPARQAYVDKIAAKRAVVQAEINKLQKEREAYQKAAKPRSAAPSFDDSIGAALKVQGKKAGIRY
jgi:hypothetical protein